MERRTCLRFIIPGATVYYREEGLIFPGKYSEDYFPVYDISRGGLRFLNQNFMRVGAGVTLKVIIPQEEIPLVLKGKVSWISTNPGRSYKYQVGIQFAPYGRNKNDNSPEDLNRLISMEERFPTSTD